ncbi:MAG: hypothetical protein AMXMBFR57_34550 [Acidimicrobiia bacterium]|jgi:hypothetical protein
MTMAAMPPRAVLSEHIEQVLAGRRVLAAAFLTFQFDPGFFEQDILPLFFQVPLSHAPTLKLAQLEDAIKDVPSGIAVYYDRNGIVPEAGGAKLDVQRIPMHQATGIFHPKNIFALVEATEADDCGHTAKALLVSSLSANLTRTGWWENVEVCHTEVIEEGDFTKLKGDLISFIKKRLVSAGPKSGDDHRALKAILAFLQRTDQRQTRSAGGQLHTQFYDGSQPVVDFLKAAAGRSLSGMNLEVISPYFDEGFDSSPLHTLISTFVPKETRVFLPRGNKQEVLCSKAFYQGVRQRDDVLWGRLPADLLSFGKQADGARTRSVHAKVYRFFQTSPKREVLFIGSANLTRAAHNRGGNLETGFLVEVEPRQKPDWWLMPDTAKASDYIPRSEDEGSATGGGSPLVVRYSWNTSEGALYWDAPGASPAITLLWSGVDVLSRSSLPARDWVTMDAVEAKALETVLKSTSLLEVRAGNGPEAFVLVQEEGMHARPSVLFDLTPAEILKYWSLLTASQRAEFLQNRAPEIAQSDEGAELLAKFERLVADETFFDRFAGIFLAFGNLERAVSKALPANEKEAAYRLFGQKHDSLPNLVRKVTAEATAGKGDPVDQYVTLMCARQACQELKKRFPEFFKNHRKDAAALDAELGDAQVARDRLIAGDPEKMPAFLEWFDGWFLRRATPKAESAND